MFLIFLKKKPHSVGHVCLGRDLASTLPGTHQEPEPEVTRDCCVYKQTTEDGGTWLGGGGWGLKGPPDTSIALADWVALLTLKNPREHSYLASDWMACWVAERTGRSG